MPPRRRTGFGLRAFLSLLLMTCAAHAQKLILPPRPADAPTGSEFAKTIADLDRPEREEKIYQEITRGNVPPFLRKLCDIQGSTDERGKTDSITYYVTSDYLAVGNDTNYFFTPLTPITAQRIADFTHCTLPTPKIVNDIYGVALVKLTPEPIPPTPAMTTVPIFLEHNTLVQNQRAKFLADFPLGILTAGDKKDVVITTKLATASGKVAIYGWHKDSQHPIQPLYVGHAETWADYSHGIRLVQSAVTVNDHASTVAEVLADPNLCNLLSDEGPVALSHYPANFRATNSLATNSVTSANHDAK